MTKPLSLRNLAVALFVALALALSTASQSLAEETEYLLGQGSLVNTGKDNGHSEAHVIDKNDVHWGWQLGSFYVTDFTRVIERDNESTMFLKNVGDEITLWFDLEQDIDRLNDDEALSISEDKNGWNEHFQVAQQNFGRGMLIVKHTDYTNTSQTTLYQDFLAGVASPNATTKVDVFEEGDYEVALNYEIRKPVVSVFGWKPSYRHFNYQMIFKFSVRNGNSMVFPFDVETGEEMANAAVTANGFRLDLARSRYLDIDIKREVLNESRDGLSEDTRFNRPARDGSEYTEEGTYTITVRNRYTGQETTKVIYVGSDDILKANAATGESVSDIMEMVAAGATIAPDGSIIPAQGPNIEAEYVESSEPESGLDDAGETISEPDEGGDIPAAESDAPRPSTAMVVSIAVGSVAVVLIATLSVFLKRRANSQQAVVQADESGSE